MTAKQYLNRARRIDKRINDLLAQVKTTKESLESITQNYGGDITSGTKNPHKFDRLVELESLVDEKVYELIAVKTEIIKTLSQLEDNRYYSLLNGYYLEMKTWEQVAIDNNYSYPHTMRLYGQALQAVDKILKHDIK